jgi:hypothetical protein
MGTSSHRIQSVRSDRLHGETWRLAEAGAAEGVRGMTESESMNGFRRLGAVRVATAEIGSESLDGDSELLIFDVPE